MNLAYLGTPKISAYALEELLKDFNFSWVLSQCDKECGRGLKCVNTPVKELALKKKLKIYQPQKINKEFFNTHLKESNVDIGVVLAYGQYIPSYLINNFKYGILNIHLSLLPKYRGSSPVQAAILNNDTHTGVSIMSISKNIDEGPILAQKIIEIDKDIMAEALTYELVKEGVILLKDCIKNIDNIVYKTQDEKQASYTSKINKDAANFIWEEDAISIHNKVRVFSKWPGVFVKIKDKLLKIKKTSYELSNIEEYSVGQIIKVDKNCGLYVKTGKNVLIIERLQAIGKKEMNICEFINGTKLKEGMFL